MPYSRMRLRGQGKFAGSFYLSAENTSGLKWFSMYLAAAVTLYPKAVKICVPFV
jgi:hypothetical protein